MSLTVDPDVTRLSDGDSLTVPDLLPGWSGAVADLGPLVFE